MFGDFAPKLAELTDDVLFQDVWNRLAHGMAAMGVAKELFTDSQ